MPWSDDREDDLKALVERARDHVEAGEQAQADELYQIILKQSAPPTTYVRRVAYSEACAFYARAAVANKRFGTAADWYREALAVDPPATDFRLELCTKALLPMNSLKEAKAEATKATKIDPEYPKAWHVLGGIEHQAGNAEASIVAYEKQLELAPNEDGALLDRAAIALDVADYDRVRELCVKISPARKADATHCLAMVAYREGRHDEAIRLYDEAIALGCADIPLAQWNKSLAQHSIGLYAEGFANCEKRGEQKANPGMALPMRRFRHPIWNGEAAPARVHVHHEAGMGDNLCLARYLKLMVDQGYDVRYEAHEDMVGLIQRSFPDVKVVARAKDYPGALGIPDFDFHLPIGSAPAVFKTDINTVPWYGPYLKPDPNLVRRYQSLLPKDKRKIGLCWSSGIREGIWIKEYGLRKSMHFRTMAKLLNTKDRFVNLQIGPERSQKIYLVDDLLPEKPTWDETAALIECLDLVITVDTAVAHLAGALDKPVWVLVGDSAASFHFMANVEGASWQYESPWYPSAKLFRQQRGVCHEWDHVITEVAHVLQ